MRQLIPVALPTAAPAVANPGKIVCVGLNYKDHCAEQGVPYPDRPLRIIMIGTDFEVRVWETLLGIPMGKCSTYSDIANRIGKPKASRAVESAVADLVRSGRVKSFSAGAHKTDELGKMVQAEIVAQSRK